MESGVLLLIGGGARSGKSAYAERRALSLGKRPFYVATSQAFDDEMRARIRVHREGRGDGFETVECPLRLPETIAALPQGAVVLVDCLTLWLSNLLCADYDDATIRARFDDLRAALAPRTRHVLLVTNEVGLGIVPDNALARRFRDLAGILHQELGVVSDEVYFGALGQLLRLKPGPVQLAEVP
jgi:adenosylcobinamide kinase/adenosylcobinamide-phosphate guanylyltransferase